MHVNTCRQTSVLVLQILLSITAKHLLRVFENAFVLFDRVMHL